MILVGNDHQVLQQGTKKDTYATLEAWQKMPVKGHRIPKDSEKKAKLLEFRAHLESGSLDEQLLQDFTLNQTKKSSTQGPASLGGEALIEMDGVHVQYGDKVVLGDWKQKVNDETKDGLHWRVRRGQRWAILGANGSGKTTLLSLITSDHPQTYSQPIKMFGRSRLPEAGKPGISIFELQSRMGHSSPEIHAFFPRQLTVREALESAFAETFLSKPELDHEKDLDVSAALRAFKAELDPNAAHEEPPSVYTGTMFPNLDPEGSRRSKKATTNFYMPLEYQVEYADHIKFGELSTAQQRIVLFLRALIHKPDIVILDEPFSGLTASQRDKCLQFIETGETPENSKVSKNIPLRHRGLSEDQALVLISHVKEEIPDSVRYYMRLPSELGLGAEPVDFRAGILKDSSVLSDSAVWDLVWSPADQFVQKSQKTTVDRESEEVGNDDFKRFGYYTI
jgi:ABC-type molybdenum transport system ATPase subunit/photorepair protein PhrA